MKFLSVLIVLLAVSSVNYAQYFPNPSFEGPFPLANNPPPGWENCDGSPDTQPDVWDVPTLPSDGDSYVGMCWLPTWTEMIWTALAMPLKADSCYKIEIDLAFYDEINYYGWLQSTFPMKIKIIASSLYCVEGDLLWESPYIDHFNWITYDFVVEPDADIENIIIKTYFDMTMPEDIGYMLMDNIQVFTPPDLDLGNDTTICNNDSVLLYPGPGFDEYVWQDGSNDSVYYASEPGTYWVEGITDYGCSRYDTIVVEQSPDIDLGPDTVVCIGDTLQLSAGPGYSTYMWFNGTTDSTLQLWDVGQYLVWVIVSDSLGCMGVDSLHLSIINDSTTVDLGPDTLVCASGAYTIYPGYYQEYSWQDGSTDSVFLVTEPGQYWVNVLGDCGYGSDTVIINFFPEPELNLGNDTLVCDDIILELDAGDGFESYFWQDSTTAQTFQVNTTGIYWVLVTDENGCEASDTIHVELSSAVVVSLGQDTTVCAGDNFLLDPGNEFASYTWQDGSTEPHYLVTAPGLYFVTVTDEMGCSGTDSVNISLNPSPEVSIGNDTVICDGGSVLLDPGSQYSSYLWQDNSTLPVYTVTTPGYYSVVVTNIFACEASDEVFVDFSSPEVPFGGDSLLCLGDTIWLDAGDFESYLWHDSTSSRFYPADSGGMYTVTVTDELECQAQSTIEIIPLLKPLADLGPDRPICLGESIILEAQPGPYLYMWNGNPGGTFIEVDEGGTYTLEVSNDCGVEYDEVVVTEYPIPEIDLGDDQILQTGEVIELDAGDGHDTYLWQDGSMNRYYQVTFDNADPDNPYYYVEVTDGPCKSSDTTKIELLKVKIPNVITPNGDGVNDIFLPMEGSWSGVSKHHIEIFNRWGEKVWESDNFSEGWDGRRNGTYVADGTYFWVLEIYYGDNDVSRQLKGTLTVIGAP